MKRYIKFLLGALSAISLFAVTMASFSVKGKEAVETTAMLESDASVYTRLTPEAWQCVKSSYLALSLDAQSLLASSIIVFALGILTLSRRRRSHTHP